MKILQMAVKVYHENIEGKQFPSCFDDAKQYNTWKELEGIAHTMPRQFPCRDCDSQYQSKMRDSNRCAIGALPVGKITRAA